ncbi:MoaD/ThiS family protein [Rapidithrix thailandica]|uniref:MoaD/ThiS family protein n=1 Tax=Rapidithrix thailandica TaxID=413964 RepID=A0AAW9RS81_9BACT
MKIKIKYTAQLKSEAGKTAQEYEVKNGESITELMANVAEQHSQKFRTILFDEKGQFRPSMLIAYNGNRISPATSPEWKENDEITLMSPIAGG